ncbi:hypothetical protein [Rhodococcus sp. NPDC057529]|uniref:hypothetical protein n=1 Tax=Rhodococcus sp. NPDC057529 TaxID=3346158 RepID=UPI0036710580
MSTPILIDIAVGDALAGDEPDRFDPVSPAAAVTVTEAAQEAGVAALRLLDTAGGRRAIDPSVAGVSFDRATAGRVGVVLRPGAGYEVSAATVPDPAAAGPVERWSEYAEILTRLWESFPRDALIGDQERALVVDDALVRAIDHEGRFYRVAAPLDGPSSVQGRPVVVADPDVLGWAVVARSADAVIVDRGQSAGADLALTAGLEQAGRQRDDVVLIGRAEVTLSASTGPTLRACLGLRDTVEALS